MDTNTFASLITDDDVATLRLRRPPLNFLNLEMLRQIQSQLDKAGESPPFRALVIDSDLPAFSAGLEMQEQLQDSGFLLIDQYHSVARLIANFPRPTIGLVRGVALGAGNELAACCDYVFAAESATFGQPEIKVGVIPTLAPLLLPQLIGARRTLDLILTGDLLDAREAARIGLIHCAVPEPELQGKVDALLEKLRALSIPVSALALQSARGERTRLLDTQLREIEALYLNDLLDLEDPVEGVRAFFEKRAPKWGNR